MEQAGGNQELIVQQQSALEKGFAAAREGRQEEARVQFEAAQGMNEKLVAQGIDAREQDAKLRAAREQLKVLNDKEQAQAAELHKQVEKLTADAEYDKAIEAAKQLRTITLKNSDADELSSTIQDLLIKAANKKAQEAAAQRKTDVAAGQAQAEAFDKDGTIHALRLPSAPPPTPPGAPPPPPPYYVMGEVTAAPSGQAGPVAQSATSPPCAE